MEANKFPTDVTLCLSGGAGRGAYQLGIISVLQEYGIEIKAVSGTSIGALIGASLACGKKADYIFEVMRSPELRSVFKLRLGHGYLFELNHKAAVVEKLIDRESFEALDFPLHVSVCDVKEESALYFEHGNDLKEVVLASCSIPPLFNPVSFNGKVLVDGGLVDNFPVEQLKKYNSPIIGINLHPKRSTIPTTILGWLKNNIHTAWQSKYSEKAELCDIYFCNKELLECKVFSFADIDKAYEIGRVEMQNFMEIQKR
jgi:NTE family protein